MLKWRRPLVCKFTRQGVNIFRRECMSWHWIECDTISVQFLKSSERLPINGGQSQGAKKEQVDKIKSYYSKRDWSFHGYSWHRGLIHKLFFFLLLLNKFINLTYKKYFLFPHKKGLSLDRYTQYSNDKTYSQFFNVLLFPLFWFSQ